MMVLLKCLSETAYKGFVKKTDFIDKRCTIGHMLKGGITGELKKADVAGK